MNEYVAGVTSVVDAIFLQDSTSTTGGGKTGLVYNTAGLTCYYKRSSGSASVVVTLADITTPGTFVSGGFKAIDGTNMPGLYEFHPPDAAFASGAREVTFFFQGATGLVPRPIKYRIHGINVDDATRAGLSALPTAAANANGGLPVLSSSGTTLAYTVSTLTTYTGNTPQTGDAYARIGAAGAGLTALGDTRIANLDAAITTRMATYTQPSGFLAATFPGTVASPTNITAGTITTVTNLTNLPAPPTDWLTAAGVSAAAVTKVQAGLSTYAGGAVASVTGDVGGNVTGTVGGLTTAALAQFFSANSGTTYAAAVAGSVVKEIVTNVAGGGGGGLDAAGVRAAVGLAAANLDTQLADRTGYLLAPAGLDAVVVEAGVNARQALAPILAACAGTIAGQETGTVTIKGGNVTTTRIVAVTDASGNRTAVTLTLPS